MLVHQTCAEDIEIPEKTFSGMFGGLSKDVSLDSSTILILSQPFQVGWF